MTDLHQFQSLFEPHLLDEIDKVATVVHVKEGDTLLDLGQTVRVMPIVLSGTVRVTRQGEGGHELLLYYISPKESCAMTFTCCMQVMPSEIKAVAEEDSTLLAIPVTVMDQWLMKYPTWKSYVMRTIRSRFNELLQTIDQIAFQKLDERLIHYLRKKSAATGSSLINLSHEQIANELATSRVVVSRLLKKLENDKRVLLYRSQIKLLREL
jgi:CRP/FNR family transcriptional regulator